MKKRHLILIVAVLVVMVSASLSFAAEIYPCSGRVTGNNVNVRSGPDISYYVVAKLMRDNSVEVVGKEGDWYQIVPPAGCFSWVAKACVNKSAGRSGVISSKRAAIRSGSSSTDRKNSIQLLASEGQSVTIIGEVGDWYKITPPTGAYVWISQDYVKCIAPRVKAAKTVEAVEEVLGDDADAAEAVGKEALKQGVDAVDGEVAASQPAVGGVTGVTAGGVAATQPTTLPTTQPVKGAQSFSEIIAGADADFALEQKKPLADRELDGLIDMLVPIAVQKDDLQAAREAKVRLAAIRYQQDSQAGLIELNKIKRQYEKEIGRVKVPAIKNYDDVDVKELPLQGTGVLRPSLVFSGPLMPERYRLFDVEKRRTIAYVEIAVGAKVNISEYIGKCVSIFGTSCIDAKLGYRVIKATSFKVIQEKPASIE